ncbi:AraC family transcriptional regulator [Bradyrhizobium sp.]|uniref:AraC family transcriptional regulator n=1 Tax=Bradyrhizobium sp. TaxID=376 RepID=UPI0039E5C56F
MRTRNVDEAIEAVSKVYCPHSISVTGRAAGIDSVLEIIQPGPQPLVHLSYAAPVTVDAGQFDDLFLAIRSTGGRGCAQQDGQSASWRAGQTLLFSAGKETRIQFAGDFTQTSVRLDTTLLENVCSRWLGHPIDEPVRFDFRPFPDDLEQGWSHILGMLAAGSPPDRHELRPRRLLDEYLLSFLLQHQPSNYSAELQREVRDPSPRILRKAEQFIRESAESPITVLDIAAEMGVSVRALQAAFRTWKSTTPSKYLREIRLQRVRDRLIAGGSSTSVTELAFGVGFNHLGRFSEIYRKTYGESPNETLLRSRKAERRGAKI